MKIKYKTQLFLYFLGVFFVFTIAVVFYSEMAERESKAKIVEAKLDIFSRIAEINLHDPALAPNLRITSIDNGGKVLYDNGIDSSMCIENHFSRPEIMEASKTGYGSDIRVSESLGESFLYFARKTPQGYIRVALPYDLQTRLMLKSDDNFLIFISILFVLSLGFLWLITRKFGNDMTTMANDITAGREAKIKLKAEMTSAVAHELRTPVSAIRGYTETLLDDSIPEDKRIQFTNRTHVAAIRLSELLRDISMLSKIEDNGQIFNTESIAINELIDEVESEFSEDIEKNSVKFENILPENIVINGNRTLLYTIFRNLIENSLAYAGKWITIKIELVNEDSDFYYFRFADSGVGIKDASLDRIFERFYRVDTGRSRESGGSGLGLAIVRHAVLYHNGTITAENVPTGGLAVNFSIKK